MGKVSAQPPKRCTWAANGSANYVKYHDTEWGVPVHDDRTHFEFLILEGAQAGLSWSTILNKRKGYKAAFANFNPARVAAATLNCSAPGVVVFTEPMNVLKRESEPRSVLM